jgi:hypothetical protein
MVGYTGRTSDSRRIRRLKSPRAFEVEANADGVPMRVNHGGIWQDVTLARRPWRIDQHWWRGDHVRRDYYRLALQDGPPLTVYCNLVTGEWERQEY